MDRAFWLTGVLLALEMACVPPRSREAAPPSRASVDVAPSDPAPVAEPSLYTAQEALDDVLSGELEYVGTGRWPGVERSRACAFRNQRVVIVNDYCTLAETQAVKIDVYSPERGRVRIYAETYGAVSARRRRDYFTFVVESSPALRADGRVPPLRLAMPYEELRRYEQLRYDTYPPSCYGGEQNRQVVGGCIGALGAHADSWGAQNRKFIERASDEWYRVVRQLRVLASQYGVARAD